MPQRPAYGGVVQLTDPQGNPQAAQQPPLVLAHPDGGARRTVGHVLRKRRVTSTLLWNPGGATIPTSSYEYSPIFPVSAYDELLIVLTGLSLTGVAAGLQWVLQIYEPNGGVYGTLPNGGPFAFNTQTGTNVLDVRAFTNFGDWLRVGVTCTTAFTGGSIAFWLKGKQ